MQIHDLVSTANKNDENVSEKDVIDYFKGNNFGHWPSEKSEIALNAEDGSIILSSQPGEMVTSHTLTPAGKKWLLSHFFKQSTSQSVEYFEEINYLRNNDVPTVKDFHQRLVQRMAGLSKFIRTGNTRLAFVERKRVNLDGSKLYSYDIINMDKDLKSKHAIMIPSTKPLMYVFEEYKKKIVRSRLEVNGRYFEGIEPWERAEYIAMTPVDIFDVQPVSRSYIQDVFALTETADEIVDDALAEKVKTIFEES